MTRQDHRPGEGPARGCVTALAIVAVGTLVVIGAAHVLAAVIA